MLSFLEIRLSIIDKNRAAAITGCSKTSVITPISSSLNPGTDLKIRVYGSLAKFDQSVGRNSNAEFGVYLVRDVRESHTSQAKVLEHHLYLQFRSPIRLESDMSESADVLFIRL